MTPQDPTHMTGRRAAPRAYPLARGSAHAAIDVRDRFIGWLRIWLPYNQELDVVWTHNRSTWLSCRRSGSTLHLRLHTALAEAGPEVAQALAAYLRCAPKSEQAALRAYLGAIPHEAAPRRIALRARGAVHDLLSLAAQVNAGHFGGASSAAITWGRAAPPSRRRRSMVLGSYNSGQHLIRLHPALDQPFVPDFVVCGVIFHEMLHEAMGFGEGPGRRALHPKAFLERERAYPDYARCRAWEAAHIHRLLAVRV